MRQLGEIVGVSDSYIAHVESGRADPPLGARLQKYLDVFEIKEKSFYERVRLLKEKVTPRGELMELVGRMSDDKVTTLLAIAKGICGC